MIGEDGVVTAEQEQEKEKETKPEGVFAIKELYVYVQKDPSGKESVVTIIDDNLIMPCLTASKNSLPKLRKIAQAHADKTHSKVALLHFTNREEVEVIEELLVKKVDKMMLGR